MTESLRAALAEASAETELHEMRAKLKGLRDLLAGALCAVCGEPLGHDEDITSDAEDRTKHFHCEDDTQ